MVQSRTSLAISFVDRHDQLKLIIILNDESESARRIERRYGNEEMYAGSMNESDRERDVGEARRSLEGEALHQRLW